MQKFTKWVGQRYTKMLIGRLWGTLGNTFPTFYIFLYFSSFLKWPVIDFIIVALMFVFFKDLICYLFEKESTPMRGEGWRGNGRGRTGFPLSRDSKWGSIPGPLDHDLSQRQMPNRLSHPGAPPPYFFNHPCYRNNHGSFHFFFQFPFF